MCHKRDSKKDLQICSAATPGPWIYLFGDRFIYTKLEDGCRGKQIANVEFGKPEDTNFIAESRKALPYWIKRTIEAERLLKATYPYLHEIYDDENQIRIAIGKFLGGGEG